ncbi:MAG: tetratricopeptide repeat protein [Rhodothermaceae bacterium]|nr:tetratricopeptide repeat protein [Rhodothermaceae bacterium]
MIRFFKEHPQYYSIYLVASFFLFVVVWFSTNQGATQATESYTSYNSQASPSSLGADFSPSALNVTRSTTKQLDALRMRVVESPEDTMHVVRLARMLQNAHQPNEASKYFKHYLALRPENRQAWLDLAQNLAELKRWEEAQKAMESMLTHFPDDPSGLYNLGAIYANQARIEEARQIWTQVATQSSDLSVAEMAASSIDRLKSFLKP